jgi:minor histocompatibility antigen H13
MMVTVAKNLDIPIKLLFPRPAGPDDGAKRGYSMLGLGDIVLPGIVMGLAIRFDLYLFYLRKQRSAVPVTDAASNKDEKAVAEKSSEVIKAQYVSPGKNWANHIWTTSLLGYSQAPVNKIPDSGQFPKTYFHASIAGYIAGMVVTLSAMHWSSHPQPALLYLVPGVLISLWGTALVRGELKDMWAFTEEEEEEPKKDDKKKDGESTKDEKDKEKTKGSRSSIFSSAHDVRREEAVRRAAKRLVEAGESESDDEASKVASDDKSPSTKEEALEKAIRRSRRNDLISFSVSRFSPLRRSGANKENEANWVPTDTTVKNGEPAGKRLRTA